MLEILNMRSTFSALNLMHIFFSIKEKALSILPTEREVMDNAVSLFTR